MSRSTPPMVSWDPGLADRDEDEREYLRDPGDDTTPDVYGASFVCHDPDLDDGVLEPATTGWKDEDVVVLARSAA